MNSFWPASWAWAKRAFRVTAALLPALLLILGAGILVALGAKNVQIGGLLAKLFGKASSNAKAIDVANSIPEDRVDAKGHVIPVGSPDAKGSTQAKVVAIESGGFFGRDDQVRITPPGETAPVVIDLPDGVRAKDVDKVIIVAPAVYAVTVTHSSKVSPKDVADLLAKYGDPK